MRMVTQEELGQIMPNVKSANLAQYHPFLVAALAEVRDQHLLAGSHVFGADCARIGRISIYA